jgi:hypothetical protein
VLTALDDDVLTEIEKPTLHKNPEAETRRRAERLVAALDGRRERLFELQSLFMLRLHRASDDFGATEGLRVVDRAIAMISRTPSDWARVKGCGAASTSVP